MIPTMTGHILHGPTIMDVMMIQVDDDWPSYPTAPTMGGGKVKTAGEDDKAVRESGGPRGERKWCKYKGKRRR